MVVQRAGHDMRFASAFRTYRFSIAPPQLRPLGLAFYRRMPSPAASAADRIEVQDRIDLTDAETALFDTLLAAATHAGTGTVLRCAGGWVRDKLLGRNSLDIDIALDNMLGKEFADKVS